MPPWPPAPHSPRRCLCCPCLTCCPSAPSVSAGQERVSLGLGLGPCPSPPPHGGPRVPGRGAPTRYWKSQTSPSWGLSPARRVLLLEVRMLNLRNLWGRERPRVGGQDPRGGHGPACHVQCSLGSHPFILGGSLQETTGCQRGVGPWDPRGQAGGCTPAGPNLSMWILASMRWLRSWRRTSRRARAENLVAVRSTSGRL